MLRQWIGLAQCSPSARNDQPLKFVCINKKEQRDALFPFLSWAGYLKDWEGPAEHERPTAYIILLGDKSISKKFKTDSGIACQSILLGSVENGFGGCILGALKRKAILKTFRIPENFEILYVLALGKPSEKVIIDFDSNDTHYYRDDNDIHHVPKRSLDDLIIDVK